LHTLFAVLAIQARKGIARQIDAVRFIIWRMLAPKPLLVTEGAALLHAARFHARHSAVKYLLEHKVDPHLTVVSGVSVAPQTASTASTTDQQESKCSS
jgi:hypothetical protein